jgi:hypothetical protein
MYFMGNISEISEQIPEVGTILEEILKEKNIKFPRRAISYIDMMSNDDMSVRSEVLD